MVTLARRPPSSTVQYSRNPLLYRTVSTAIKPRTANYRKRDATHTRGARPDAFSRNTLCAESRPKRVVMSSADISSPAKVGLTAVATLMITLVSITLPLTKNEEGEFSYIPAAAVMLAELLKLAMAMSLWLRSHRDEGGVLGAMASRALDRDVRKEFALFAIPSLLYFVLNNLALVIQRAISPVSYQLISQLKTVLTAILFVGILGRRLTPQQWLALAMLSCATASAVDSSGASRGERVDCATAAQSSSNNGEEEDGGGGVLHAKYSLPASFGVLLTVLSSFLSALAGVFTELLLKSRPTSVHAQNAQMYTWGVGFSVVWLAVDTPSRERVAAEGLLVGFGITTWLYVLVQACLGLTISFVLKYVDNLARVFASSAALVITLLLSCWLFGAVLTAQLAISTVLVALAMLQYSLSATQLDDLLEPLYIRAAQLSRCCPAGGLAAAGHAPLQPPPPPAPPRGAEKADERTLLVT